MRLKTVAVICGFIGVSYGMVADLYLNKDKFGEYFKLEINEKGCTNVPLNWENQAVSVDTHGSCIKFYDLPYCRGKYVALQPYHGTFQDNLKTVGFSKVISSASPCGPKVPTGRYYVQNGADGSVLTIETRNNSPIAFAHQFKPYISKGQQFQIERVSLADYEITPRVHQKMNPVTYDMSISTSAHPVRRTWKIESVYRGRYLIKNEWSNRCLYKTENGKVEEHECVAWSPNQEWIFRSIKVKPYFPSKEDLKKKPLRPDDGFPFEAQDDAFSSIPYNPNANGNKIPALPPRNQNRPSGQGGVAKRPVQVQRPGPIVINPGEPFPPVLPFPIRPNNNWNKGKRGSDKPPVPHVRHPGPLPFPSSPVVTDPKKPSQYSPFDTYNVFTPNKTKVKISTDEDDGIKDDGEDLNDENDESLEEQEEADEIEDENKSENRSPGRPRERPNQQAQGDQEEFEQESNERDEGVDEDASEEQEQQDPGQDLKESGERDVGSYEFSEAHRDQEDRDKRRKPQPDTAKYSDYRLRF